MHAAGVDALPASCPGGCVYEPKWDGWRALLFVSERRVLLQSRTGKPLAGYFPDLTRAARGLLPAGTVLDGELIIWDQSRARTSFALLQRRVTASRTLLRETTTHPAHMVCFDVLQVAGRVVMADPLVRRRDQLVRLLADAPAQLTLCPQTTDPAEALGWLDDWSAAGVEGLVIKGLGTPYQPGRRAWAKLRARSTTEAIIGGVTGSLSAPEAVLLGRLDDAGRLRYVGRSVPLAVHQPRELASFLVPPSRTRASEVDHPWPAPLPAGWLGQLGNTTPLAYHRVAPVVVAEVEVDAAYEYGRWRHQPRFVRIRADLSVYDAPPYSTMDG